MLKIAQILSLKAVALGLSFVENAQKREQKFIPNFFQKAIKALANEVKIVYN